MPSICLKILFKLMPPSRSILLVIWVPLIDLLLWVRHTSYFLYTISFTPEVGNLFTFTVSIKVLRLRTSQKLAQAAQLACLQSRDWDTHSYPSHHSISLGEHMVLDTSLWLQEPLWCPVWEARMNTRPYTSDLFAQWPRNRKDKGLHALERGACGGPRVSNQI